MPELGKAYVQIVPSAKGIKGAIEGELKGESIAAGESAGATIGESMSGSMLKAITAAGIGAAIGSMLSKTISAAVSSFADYEQLTGGIETLFGESADTVQRYAENAYKTAGLSANNYMETVTSFSASLLQSLGGDTEEAARLADQAITDMADNANKMGSSMESIQNAYQGFAKQNYTMLDNLKIGYGGTKTEMERLLADAEAIKAAQGEVASYSIDSYADIVEAIHVVQTEMGITGTTAEEASETISGSMNSAKASWQNLLTAMADGNGDVQESSHELVESVKTMLENLAPAVKNAFLGIGEALLDSLGELIFGTRADLDAVELAISGIQTAQENLANSEHIIELVAQYRELSQKAEDANLSVEEASAINEELAAIREQLATATGNAAIAEGLYGDVLDAVINKEERVAEAEAERAKAETWKNLRNGADAYQHTLADLAQAEADLAAEQTLLETARENKTKANVDVLTILEDKVNEVTESLTNMEEGQAKADYLAASLSELEGLFGDLGFDDVTLTGMAQAEELLDELSAGGYDTADAYLEAATSVESLTDRIDTLTAEAAAYESSVMGLLAEGFITAEEAAEQLGISVEEIGPKLEAYEAAQEAAAAAADELSAAIDQQSAAAAAAAEISQELTDSYPAFASAAESAGISLDRLSEYLNDNGITAGEWAAAVSGATDSVINDFESVETSLGLTLEQMAANLQGNIEAYQSWRENIAALMQAAEESGDATAVAFVQYMADMGVGAADQVAAMAQDIDGTLAEFAPLMAEAMEQGVLEVSGALAETAEVESAASGMADAAYTAADSQDFTPVGTNMAAGVASGIKAGRSGVINAAVEMGVAALRAVQARMEIQSPSRVFHKEVGEMLTAGIATGMVDRSALNRLSESADAVTSYIARMFGVDLNGGDSESIRAVESWKKAWEAGLDDIIKVNEHAAKMMGRNGKSGTEIAKAYRSIQDAIHAQAEQARAMGLEETDDYIMELQDLWWRYEEERAQAIQEEVEAQARAYEEAYKRITDAVGDFADAFESEYDAIIAKQEQLAGHLADFGDYFSYTDEERGLLRLEDLNAQAEAILELGDSLQELRERGINEGLLAEIANMSHKDAWNFAQKLLDLSDEAFDTYNDGYQRKIDAAQSVAEQFYQQDLTTLQEEYLSKVPEVLSGLEEDMRIVGMRWADAISAGFGSRANVMADALKSTLQSVYLAAGISGGTLNQSMASMVTRTGDYAGDNSVDTVNAIREAVSMGISSAALSSGSSAVYLDGMKVGYALQDALRLANSSNPEVQTI